MTDRDDKVREYLAKGQAGMAAYLAGIDADARDRAAFINHTAGTLMFSTDLIGLPLPGSVAEMIAAMQSDGVEMDDASVAARRGAVVMLLGAAAWACKRAGSVDGDCELGQLAARLSVESERVLNEVSRG